METVTITMSRKTAEAVKQACEEYLRLRMGQFEDFTNEVCCWDYVEQMEKECRTTEERKKFHRDHEQDFYKCMRLRDRMRAGLRALWAQNVPTASIQFTLKEAYRAESVWLAIRYALAWHDSFSWVCFNGLSEHRADFTDPENTCQEWKERKDEND